MHGVVKANSTVLTPLRAALVVLVVAAVTIAGAWAFQAAGYMPCDLCLKQRYAYYVGVPLALIVVLAAAAGRPRALIGIGLALLALVFAASAVFGAFHAGVEWGWWKGPAECTGAIPKALSPEEFLKQLQTAKAIRCDAAAIRILGLSLAGWNAVVSVGLAIVAGAGLARLRRSRPPRPSDG